MLKSRNLHIAALAAITLMPAQAITVYVTSLENHEILTVDTVTHTAVVKFTSTTTYIDSLVFEPNGDLLYSTLTDGTVHQVNLSTQVDTVIATGFTDAADIMLDPSGTTFLLSDRSGDKVDRVTISNGNVATFLNPATSVQGLVYDGSRLFAVVGKKIEELNPSTGAVLHSSPTLNAPDGLTFDATTGFLYAADNQSCVYRLNPNALSTASTTCFATIPNPSTTGTNILDGITSDGAGDLFVVSRPSTIAYATANHNAFVYEFNGTTGLSVTPVSNNIYGLDDITYRPGSSVPEPGTFYLIGVGLLAIGAARISRGRSPL
jgi:hypothetical protein